MRHFISFPKESLIVRLACLRHAASVDSEPGSNSRLNSGCTPSPGRRSVRDVRRMTSKCHAGITSEMTRPQGPSQFSRLARSTMLSKILADQASAVCFGSRTRSLPFGGSTVVSSNLYALLAVVRSFLPGPPRPLAVFCPYFPDQNRVACARYCLATTF